MTELTPIPVYLLVDTHCQVGSNQFADGLCGWTAAAYDHVTGTLTLAFERDPAADPIEGDPDHASATYRFQLILDNPAADPSPMNRGLWKLELRADHERLAHRLTRHPDCPTCQRDAR